MILLFFNTTHYYIICNISFVIFPLFHYWRIINQKKENY